MRTLLFLVSMTAASLAADAPNILWITAEDMSPTLGCYGDEYAITPHIDQLAADGVTYDNAFATAPVCSPSRSCLINGLPATSQGTQQMRSAFPLPEYMEGFPSLLRKKGRYASNNVKTDYNSGNWEEIVNASWDESSDKAHWRNRDGDQAFFSVFNLMTSHQSRTMVWPYEQFVSDVQSRLSPDEIHSPSEAPVPPYYPDTPIIRRTIARFYDCVTAMDKEVGDILQQLEDDGLADDTIVFFYADHGSGMPRHKRALLDSGLKVPLIVRFPEKYQHLAPLRPGSRTDRLVSFDDFGPTVLSLVGETIPDYMEGKPFMGAAAEEEREYTYGHRDRVDEVIDMARSVRDKRYLYIRNYMPHHGYNQPTFWPDLGEVRHEIYAHAKTEYMTGPQKHFAGPTRPLEELYDCRADPMNLNNLADSDAHQSILERMRSELSDRLRDSRDLGFIPEAYAWNLSDRSTPYQLARSGSSDYSQARLIKAASQVGNSSESTLLSNLNDRDPGVRYWGAVGLSAANSLSNKANDALTEALEDDVLNVRIEAANALARHGNLDSSIAVLADVLSSDNLSAVQHAARVIELLGEKALPALPAVEACNARMLEIRPPETSPLDPDPEMDKAMFVGFSTQTFINRFGSK